MEIRLTDKDKKHISNPADVYGIMQRILLRENKIDREKEHFWIIGMDTAGYILYIELVSLGSVNATIVEPMNVYRIAVMKNASRVIAIHNHPGGSMTPSENDKDVTDRLIQVGRILNITLEDHLIISTTTYMSFKAVGLMDKLEASLLYVPTFQIIEQIRKEEKKIAREKLELEKGKTRTARDATKAAREAEKIEKERREKLEHAMVTALLNRDVSIDDIAKIMEITPNVVHKIINKNK